MLYFLCTFKYRKTLLFIYSAIKCATIIFQ